MYVVYNKFNHHVISRHRTIGAAIEAEKKFQRSFAKHNSPGSYMPTVVMRKDKGSLSPLSEQEYEAWYCAKD